MLTGHLRLAVPFPLAAATAATDGELKSSDGLNADVLRSNESRRAVNDDVFNANPMIFGDGRNYKHFIQFEINIHFQSIYLFDGNAILLLH